ANSYKNAQGKYFYPEQIEQRDGLPVVAETGEPVETLVEKMSKSKYNVVNPDEVVATYGADAMRAYEMFMGPLDRDKVWSDEGIQGVHRFLKRVWHLYVDRDSGEIRHPESATYTDPELEKLYHKTVKNVGEHIDSLKFNTALALMMEFINAAYKVESVPREALDGFTLLLSPFCPHIAEELWRRLGHAQSLAHEAWPSYDEALTIDDVVTLVVQVNGKLRARLDVPRSADKDELERLALGHERIKPYIEGKTVRKVIVVPEKLVNVVVS
ncbi:MAG: class I tRNA ligase family protein, partial [Myxococcales bacterium]|nr:class I tRNA ligase family protein [Myxococcales bacterium]